MQDKYSLNIIRIIGNSDERIFLFKYSKQKYDKIKTKIRQTFYWKNKVNH